MIEVLFNAQDRSQGRAPDPACEVESDPRNIGIRDKICGLSLHGHPPGWFCTRGSGHDGDHMALHPEFNHPTSIKLCARWRTNEE
jgi:hypothetical protein